MSTTGIDAPMPHHYLTPIVAFGRSSRPAVSSDTVSMVDQLDGSLGCLVNVMARDGR